MKKRNFLPFSQSLPKVYAFFSRMKHMRQCVHAYAEVNVNFFIIRLIIIAFVAYIACDCRLYTAPMLAKFVNLFYIVCLICS